MKTITFKLWLAFASGHIIVFANYVYPRDYLVVGFFFFFCFFLKDSPTISSGLSSRNGPASSEPLLFFILSTVCISSHSTKLEVMP